MSDNNLEAWQEMECGQMRRIPVRKVIHDKQLDHAETILITAASEAKEKLTFIGVDITKLSKDALIGLAHWLKDNRSLYGS